MPAVYKCFIRPHLDYGDVAFSHLNLSYLINNIEPVQYIAALAITGEISAIREIVRGVGFESLQDRRCFRRLCCLYKIVSTK